MLPDIKDLMVFVPRSDNEPRNLRSSGLSTGKQALMTPRRASIEVKNATRQYVS